MRKVDLNMKSNEKCGHIKKRVDTNGNKKRAAMRLGYTIKHANRMIKCYKERKKQDFSSVSTSEVSEVLFQQSYFTGGNFFK